ncbi:hypothetical protein [Legionella worsleiensis]|uniref:hypothetical protein n=1 Tax=Legionella worsleiensis TaxID=45076 RepID=UPI000DFE7363|nr:hypothetical protein [Legionella worsleiensis]STY50010.1 Uncharacterised protein [Legionella worsleiensis]
MFKINTHQIYNTISHEHLDNLVSWATGEYPDSGLCLVECQNGNWFVEVDFGHCFDSFTNISKPELTPYIEPRFFPNRKNALTYATEIIKQVYSSIDDKKISEYFQNEE